MDSKKNKRSQGQHCKKNEVKTEIIDCILRNGGEVSGPDIRRHLKEKYGIVDRKNIEDHLKKLESEYHCIEKIEPVRDGYENRWVINKIKNLEKIREHFNREPFKIQLNKYEKSLSIILSENGFLKTQENDYVSISLSGLLFYIQLLLSNSFFNACINTDVKTLCKRALPIHMYKNTYETIRIENFLNKSYIAYKKRYPNFEILPELFKSMMEEMVQKMDEISSTEMFMEVWEKELLGLSKEKSNEMHQGSIEDDLKIYWEMRRTTILMWERNFVTEANRFDLLFEAYFYQDLLQDDVSEEEKQFAIKTKASNEEFQNNRVDDVLNDFKERYEKNVVSDLEQISIVMAKYKQPLIFDEEIYNDPKAIFEKLKEAFYRPSK